MEDDDLGAAVEKINAGEPIPTIDPTQLEKVWGAVSRIPRDRRKDTEVSCTATCVNTDFAPKNADEEIGLMARLAILNALVERGILSDYMQTEPGRKLVFAAAATIPCNKEDLAEAVSERLLRDKPSDIVAEAKESAKSEGRDFDRPKIGERFIDWIRTH